jgi:acetyltransferase-like isoleucine patch superfamily enzyme
MFINFLKKYLIKKYFSFQNVKSESSSIISKSCSFSGNNYVGKNTVVSDSQVGRFTYIANKTYIKNCRIGSFSSVGSNVKTYVGLHPSSDWVSTSPIFYNNKNPFKEKFTKNDLFDQHRYLGKSKFVVEIGNDVWIGDDVTIFDGIKIGNGAIIGAKSLVTKDVPAYTIVAGIAAKHIRRRFSDKDIKYLQSIMWWNWDLSKIRKHSPFFSSVSNLSKSLQILK